MAILNRNTSLQREEKEAFACFNSNRRANLCVKATLNILNSCCKVVVAANFGKGETKKKQFTRDLGRIRRDVLRTALTKITKQYPTNQ